MTRAFQNQMHTRNRFIAVVLALFLFVSAFCASPVAFAAGDAGDPNGDGKVNASDALLVLRAAVGKATLTKEQTVAGDVDANGTLNAADALLILKFAVGLITVFPSQMNEEERYYAALDQQYKVNYSDFEEITTLSDSQDAKEIIEALGGAPKTGAVEGYGVTADSRLSYTPISNEAKRLGKTQKYNSASAITGTVKLGTTTLKYSIPASATAYDAVPITYSVTSNTNNMPLHIEATAFEDASRYASKTTPYYDCNLPGKVAVELSYEGYVNGDSKSGTPKLSYDPSKDVQGTSYPAYDTTDLVRSGTLKGNAKYTWFKFKFTNTGNTILDGEGNSTFRFRPRLYRKEGNSYIDIGGTPNDFYPLLDYVYPGESGEFWALFNIGGNNSTFGLAPGSYRIVIDGCLRNEKDSYNFAAMQLAGSTVTTSTFEFTVTEQGAQTTPAAMTNKSVSGINRNNWLGNFEEFMASYTTIVNVGKNASNATKGVLYVQPAPWTNQIVLRVIHGNSNEIQFVRIPLKVETDSISIKLNPYNNNYKVLEDGTRTPLIMTQNMVDMRGNIDRGPYVAQTIVNDLRNMQEAGINYLTTTEAYTGDFTGLYDMSLFMLDSARAMGFSLEGHALYPYRGSLALNRVQRSGATVDLGSARDMFNLRQVDAANGILARWNLIRYGDFYHYDPDNKAVPISIEENYGWMTYNLNNRHGIDNTYCDRLLSKWLETGYNGDIKALNKRYGSSYAKFSDITVSEEGYSDNVGTVLTGEVYHDWTAATMELDLFRTAERVRNYKEMLRVMDVPQAKIALRSENGIFLAAGISQTTKNAHYRNVYYEQRRSASVPEILAASDIIYADSSYSWIPFTDAEVYELTRQAAKSGFVTAKTPSFNHLTDVVINDYVGSFDYDDKLSLNNAQKGCAIGRNASLFTFWKAMYEAGGIPGTMWMDYACDLYVTSTQYKEMLFFKEKMDEMLATKEGAAWANSVPKEATNSPIADTAAGAWSYPETYVRQQLAELPRQNLIMSFCD